MTILGILHKLLLKFGHEGTDVIWIIATGFFQIDVLALEVESLCVGTFIRTQFFRFALQLFEALCHELACALGLNRAFLVDGALSSLDILDLLRALMMQWSEMR